MNPVILPAVVAPLRSGASVPRGIVLGGALLLAAVAACGGAAEHTTLVVTDSAGVEIVQHPPRASVPVWSLGEEPEIRVGEVTGDPEFQFQQVVAAFRDRGGRLVVLDRSRRRISVFGPDGGFIAASGREGGGPGEYDAPVALWPHSGDSLAVYDPAVGRVSILGPAVEWGRSARIQPIGTLVLPAGPLGDGRLLVVSPFADPGRPGVAMTYMVSAEGLDPLMEFRHIKNQDPGAVSAGQRPLIPKVPQWSASGEWLFMVRNVDYELLIRNDRGDLRRIIRWHGRDLTATREDHRRYVDNVSRTLPEARRTTHRAGLEALAPNSRFPPFERIHADQKGRAWIQMYRQPFDEGPREWWVVAHTGELAGRIELPEGATVLDAGEGYVLLRILDEMGVQSVAQFAIEEGGAPGN